MLGMYLLHLLPTFSCSNSLMKTQKDLLKVYNRGLTKSLRSLKLKGPGNSNHGQNIWNKV